MNVKQVQTTNNNVNLTDFPANASKALLALLENGNVRIASKNCKVSQAQIFRYLNQPAFKQRLRELRRASFEQNAALLLSFHQRALLTMVELMHEKNPAFVRLSAAKTIHDTLQNNIAIESLQSDIDELKELLNIKNQSASKNVSPQSLRLIR